MSSFTWLDYSEQERQQVMQVIDLFREEETRDELGIGTIRDTLADLLFPGTSTIQTRLRYFLFIPWIMKMMEQRRVSSREAARRSRRLQGKLRDSLKLHEDVDGIIGISAGYHVQRLPSNIYWNGLSVWGIRLFPGSEASYYESLDAFNERRRTNRVSSDDEPGKESLFENWHPALPPCPDDLLEKADFSLSEEEASYLVDRIRRRRPDSLLRELLEQGVTAANDVPFPWNHPATGDLPTRLKEELTHARNFSEVIHGAALLYNLILAEQKKWNERIDHYRTRLAHWWDIMHERDREILSWDMESFWSLLTKAGGRITPHTISFVQHWYEMVQQSAQLESMIHDRNVRDLIASRERRMKRARARIGNQRLLEIWSGTSGAAQLDYRWNRPVKSYLNDLARTGTKAEFHV